MQNYFTKKDQNLMKVTILQGHYLHYGLKFIEQLMYNRIYSSFEKEQLLYGKQFGFRSKQSTIDAQIEIASKNLPFASDDQKTSKRTIIISDN